MWVNRFPGSIRETGVLTRPSMSFIQVLHLSIESSLSPRTARQLSVPIAEYSARKAKATTVSLGLSPTAWLTRSKANGTILSCHYLCVSLSLPTCLVSYTESSAVQT